MKITDFFHDIAIGITGVQTIDTGKTIMLRQVKKDKYEPKTYILDHVHSIVEPALMEIHKEYSWQHDREFNTSDGYVRIIEYPTFGDACIIKIDDIQIKVNKKYLKELYIKKLSINA
ncbi:hypothetical protein QU593_09940 [Rossellomorea marisflavi]|uniref:hypothetical protein n=1 Tax=Rossellomorea marisflavi TaxID=189381 RepID=UPI0025B2424A|nr:hypothetical protein [Rossellomorea marisflavi]WJV20724.1 hypothetical protein QU593_09940 [Rossellomorea marisflavi]